MYTHTHICIYIYVHTRTHTLTCISPATDLQPNILKTSNRLCKITTELTFEKFYPEIFSQVSLRPSSLCKMTAELTLENFPPGARSYSGDTRP